MLVFFWVELYVYYCFVFDDGCDVLIVVYIGDVVFRVVGFEVIGVYEIGVIVIFDIVQQGVCLFYYKVVLVYMWYFQVGIVCFDFFNVVSDLIQVWCFFIFMICCGYQLYVDVDF